MELFKIKTFLRKGINRVQYEFFPTKLHLTIKKWRADNGDKQLRLNYDLNKESIVLDFGGYKGQWAHDIFLKYNCQIYIFEPVKDFYEQIKNRFSKNDCIKVFQYGLGANTRDEKINLSADGSSIFLKTKASEDIRIIDVKHWIQEKNIKCIDLIKINIEGGEYELLNRLIETNLIEIIKNIQVQFHPINDNSYYEMKDIQKELAKTHSLTYQYEFVWENWVRL